MSAFDQLLNLVPLAAKKALATRESNVALHPATVPAVVSHGPLAHKEAGPPGGGALPVRVVAVLGPGATFRGIAETLLPLYTRAGVAKPLDRDDLAKGLVFYNRGFLPAGDWRHHRVGLCLPLPIEIVAATGAWTLNADEARGWAGSFLPAWEKRLSTPPTPLDVPEPAQVEGEASAVLAAPGTPASRAAALWERVLRNPSEVVLALFAVLRQLEVAGRGPAVSAALTVLGGAQGHQLALLAATRAGNGILRRLAQVLAPPPPPGTDAAKLAAARTLVDNALHQGPPGARTLVGHRELPETVDLLAAQPGSAKAVPGAKADPGGGLHRIVLGRDVNVGRSAAARVAGVDYNGPGFAGRLLLGPFLDDDAKGLNPAGDPRVAGLLALLAVDGAGGGPLDAVKARDAGLLTVGLGGWSALAPDGLAAVLFRFKSIAPDEFDLFFALHGLDVDQDPADATKFRLRKIGADGSSTVMDAAALRTFLGGTVDAKGAVTFSPDWAARSRLPALVSRRYRRAQVLAAIDRVGRTANPIELAVASVSPFPSAYKLEFDTVKSTALAAAVNGDLLDHPPAHPVGFLSAKRAAGIKSADTLAGAVVDLTGAPAKPAYAGFADDDTFYVGSMGKVAALYAAHELRLRLRRAVAAAKAAGLNVAVANWEVPFLATVRKTWGGRVAKGFPGFDTRMPARFPKLGDMFTFTAGGHVDFTKGTATIPQIVALDEGQPTPNMRFSELMTSMILMSNGFAAGLVIDAVGYPYLNGVLREGGFFAVSKGIWVSGNYDSRDWKPGVDPMAISPRGALHYKAATNFVGNAKQFARLLTLAARHQLFDGDAATCDDMIEVMRKSGIPGADNSFIGIAIAAMGVVVDKVFSKIGIGDPAPPSHLKGIHDCAIIERAKGGTTLRYVVVAVGGYDRGPDSPTYDEFVQVLDGAIDKVHP